MMIDSAQPTVLQRALKVPHEVTSNSVVRLRSALTRAARLVANAKRPTQVIGEAGLRVNQVAHDGIEQMLRHQVHVVEGFMDESAQRLQLAAEAGSLRSLVNEQVAMMPETRSRLVKDVRTALNILGDTRTGLTTALSEEFAALREMANKAGERAEEAAGEAADSVVRVTEVA